MLMIHKLIIIAFQLRISVSFFMDFNLIKRDTIMIIILRLLRVDRYINLQAVHAFVFVKLR